MTQQYTIKELSRTWKRSDSNTRKTVNELCNEGEARKIQIRRGIPIKVEFKQDIKQYKTEDTNDRTAKESECSLHMDTNKTG
jgi:hypothetical protein